MGVLNSVLIPRGRKSIGNITLSYVRGNQVAKQKVGPNGSKTLLQREQRAIFAIAEYLLKPAYTGAKSYMPRTKHGSQWNVLMQANLPIIRLWFLSQPESVKASFIAAAESRNFSVIIGFYYAFNGGGANTHPLQLSCLGERPVDYEVELLDTVGTSNITLYLPDSYLGFKYRTIGIAAAANPSVSSYGVVYKETKDEGSLTALGGRVRVTISIEPASIGAEQVRTNTIMGALQITDTTGRVFNVFVPSAGQNLKP